MNIDELIEERRVCRQLKDYKRCDELRSLLDQYLVFVFDTAHGQDIHYLTHKYFKFKDKFAHTKNMSNRSYVEYRIAEDSRANKNLDGWLYTTRKTKSS